LSQRFQSLKGKRVFVTGHTGFTGSWACIWLNQLGCDVFGYSLEPETTPNLFTEARVGNLVSGKIADIRDFETLREEVVKFQPDLVLHLAAQPLVRRSYQIPRETFEVNSQGTANVLEAIRGVESIKGALLITTDKVYKNLETDHRYVEGDELGGKDPYSSSKAAAELIIASYRSAKQGAGFEVPIISVARGGNIVGGGDWSEDRLIPDYVRAYILGGEMEIRYPEATRPWQHVLSLVDGYLTILSGMLGSGAHAFNRAFNLGPIDDEPYSVSSVLSLISKELPGVVVRHHESDLHEAGKLGLNSKLATETFGWKPRWDTKRVIEETATWYKHFLADGNSTQTLCLDQIRSWNSADSNP
jgi:CDP-glucose 4,6-dehydratase